MNPKALYQITYGLYWLSVRSYGQDNACIINTAVQVASDPLRITISVNKGNKTHDMIMDSGRFNVCALTTDTPFSLFQRFGMQSGRDVNKIGELGLTLEKPDTISVPGIKEVPITLECRVIYKQDQDLNALAEDRRLRYYKPGTRDDGDFHTAYYGEVLAAYIIE